MGNHCIDEIHKKKMSRRSFIKWSSAVTAPVIIGGAGTVSGSKMGMSVKAMESKETVEEIITTCSTLNCGGRCLVKAHVSDGVVTRLSTDSKEDTFTLPQLRACLRGRGYRQFVYHSDRLKYPMKRVGRRGEGKFEKISWEEAINYIAKELNRITDKYGPACRYSNRATGTSGSIIGSEYLAKRLFSFTGGYLDFYGTYSSGQTTAATPYTYGTVDTGSTLNTLSDSKLIILWGHNPVETRWGLSDYYLRKAKEGGSKIVVIDPRQSDTVVALADEWIPIAPTTDTAMMDAMTYVIITENLHDKDFLDKYCVGFDEEHMPEGVPAGESLESYILGKKDGIKKTPEWAEKICRVPANTIRKLAREYATNKPAALLQGWGPQRQAFGEQFARGGTVLTALTGNVGVRGGWASGKGTFNLVKTTAVSKGVNPLGELSIPCFLWTDAVVRGTEMGKQDGVKGLPEGQTLPSNIKVIFNLAGNILINQHSDCNKTAKILADENLVELIVVSDVFMTPSAKFADIVLPSNTFMETWDIGTTWGPSQHAILSQKVIDSMYESMSDYEWLTMLSEKLGVKQEFTEGKSQLDWVKWSIEESRKKDPNFPSFEEFQKIGIYQVPVEENTVVAFEKQIQDPENNKFETPSGKIEIFSKALWDMNDSEEIPAIPKYISSWEGPEDPLIEKYPLQLIGWHYKRRCHSSFDNNKWLEEVGAQEMWMNEKDARERNINNGEKVKVFNDRGEVHIPVKITNRIIPGTVAIPQGAWWNPDKDGIDQRGNINTLTSQRPSPIAKGNPQQTNLVEVAKA